MGGALKGRPAVIRPWNENWQLWKPLRKGPGFAVSQTGGVADLKIPAGTLCAIPARRVVALPFWVEASDASLARDMAVLEVEMKGLSAGERLETDVEIRILQQEESRVLVLAMVYPSEWPATLAMLRGSRYLPTPLVSALSNNTVHLWRELDDLVAVVVWEDSVIFWETMHWTTESDEIGAWLECLMLELQGDLGIQGGFLLKEWCGIFAEVPEQFRRDPIILEEDRLSGPSLLPDPRTGTWAPPAQRLEQTAAKGRKRTARVAAFAALLLFCAAVLAGAAAFRVEWQIREADAELQLLEAELAPLQSVASRWTLVESAIDLRFHPLEILRSVVTAIPSAGVRLTVFEMSPDRVVVEGEADNVSSATAFFKAIESAEDKGLRWEMAPPSLQPNNTARFAITGVREES